MLNPRLATKSVILLFAIAIVLSACIKRSHRNPHSDNGLPPLTTTGVMMFACKVNGVPWISKPGDKNLNAVRNGDSLGIYGTVPNGDNLESFGFFLLGVYNSTQLDYLLTDTAMAAATYLTTDGKSCFTTTGGYAVVDKKIPNGVVHFVKTTDGIAAGTFSFYVPRNFCDTLFITEGRFDVKYRLAN